MMREYKAENWYDIKGWGRVASVVNDEEFAKDSTHLVGEHVLIDGRVYKVRGIEAYCIKTICKGMPIGLLVEPDAAEKYE